MIVAILLQAAVTAVSPITLAEAQALSPQALATRLLPNDSDGVFVDAIINGRGALTPPSRSVQRVWLVERMVPFGGRLCRSHVFNIEMGGGTSAISSWTNAVPTHPVKIEQYDRLWVPPADTATVVACAAAPPTASGFDTGGLELQRAADLVEQARQAFASAPRSRFSISCRGDRNACGKRPRDTLAAIDWGALGQVEEISAKGEPYFVGDARPADPAWGPRHVQLTFPYAANGATWIITVQRQPAIVAVRMEAHQIVYE